MKKLILPVLGIGAWGVLLAATLIAQSFTDRAQEVYLLIPHADKTVVETNEFLFDTKPDDPKYERKLLEIYGIPTETKEKILIDPSKIQRPKKDRPDIAYFAVDKEKGENPWQLKTVLLIARVVKGGSLAAGTLFLSLFALLQAAGLAKGARSAAAD